MSNVRRWDAEMAERDENYSGLKEARVAIKARWPGCLITREFNPTNDTWMYTVYVPVGEEWIRLDAQAPNLLDTQPAIDPDRLISDLEVEISEALDQDQLI